MAWWWASWCGDIFAEKVSQRFRPTSYSVLLVQTAIRLICLLALKPDWELEVDVPGLDELLFRRGEGEQTAEFDRVLCCCMLPGLLLVDE